MTASHRSIAPSKPTTFRSWAQWKDVAYGVTTEPIVMVYNKRLLHDGMVPRDHADLLRVLTEHAAAFQGKIATL